MNINLIKQGLLISSAVLLLSVPVYAETNAETVQKEKLEAQKPAKPKTLSEINTTPFFKTLFLSQKERNKIDQQRADYLNPKAIVEKEEQKNEPKKVVKAKKKRIYIPPRVAISAVIVKPDGSTIIRVNNKYDKSPSKHINLDTDNATTAGVPITVNGKTQIVPVGQTLLTRKNRLVDTHKLQAKARAKKMPKTEQKVVKQTLEQVQILNAKPTPPVVNQPSTVTPQP